MIESIVIYCLLFFAGLALGLLVMNVLSSRYEGKLRDEYEKYSAGLRDQRDECRRNASHWETAYRVEKEKTLKVSKVLNGDL